MRAPHALTRVRVARAGGGRAFLLACPRRASSLMHAQRIGTHLASAGDQVHAGDELGELGGGAHADASAAPAAGMSAAAAALDSAALQAALAAAEANLVRSRTAALRAADDAARAYAASTASSSYTAETAALQMNAAGELIASLQAGYVVRHLQDERRTQLDAESKAVSANLEAAEARAADLRLQHFALLVAQLRANRLHPARFAACSVELTDAVSSNNAWCDADGCNAL